MGKQDAARAFLPPNGSVWTDEPFNHQRGRLPPRRQHPYGNIRRPVEMIWRRLDARLDHPLQERHASGRTQLWALDRWYFEMDRDRRRLLGGTVDRRGDLRDESEPFSLEDPLRIDLIELTCHFFGNWPTAELVSVPHADGYAKASRIVMSAVNAMLHVDPRYAALQKVLRHALGLDADVLRLAEAASCGYRPNSDDYQRVWRNLAAFREVSLHKPELLPLVLAFLEGADDRFDGDPLDTVENWFRGHSLGDAGWQRIAATPAKEWAPLWLRLQPESRLHGLLRLAKHLEESPADKPLDGDVVRAWIREIAPTEPEPQTEARRKPRFSAVVGSDNHIAVYKVAFAFLDCKGEMRFVLEDGYGNVSSSTLWSGRPSLLRESGLTGVEDVRYVVAYHSGHHAPMPGCVLKSLRDMPAHYFGPRGVESSKLAGHIAMEERLDRALAAERWRP